MKYMCIVMLNIIKILIFKSNNSFKNNLPIFESLTTELNRN